MYKLDVLGILLNFFMILPEIHGQLLVMLADGKFLPKIMEKLDMSVDDLFGMGRKILTFLDQFSPYLEKENTEIIEVFVNDYIMTEIELDNI